MVEFHKGKKEAKAEEKIDKYPPIPNKSNQGRTNPPPHEPNRNIWWETDWKLVADDEIKQLIDREDLTQQLIDQNLQGMKTLYFIREKRGGIDMVRSLTERQIQLGRVIKGPTFIGDADNVVTEIVKFTKHREAIIAAAKYWGRTRKKENGATYQESI